MPTAEYSTGEFVEHEIIMPGGGVLFLVIEMKLELPQDVNLAQLFLELLSAAKVNEKTDFSELRVYGLLTDLSSFRFYSYDPVAKSFNPDDDILINVRRDDFCYGMIQVANKIFSVIMCAYIEALLASARVEASKKKFDSAGDIPSIPPSDPTPKVKSKSRPSLSVWQNALAEAELAYSKLQKTSNNLATFEKIVSEGLEHLAKSVRNLPRVSQYTSDMNPMSPEELEALADSQVEQWHRGLKH